MHNAHDAFAIKHNQSYHMKDLQLNFTIKRDNQQNVDLISCYDHCRHYIRISLVVFSEMEFEN